MLGQLNFYQMLDLYLTLKRYNISGNLDAEGYSIKVDNGKIKVTKGLLVVFKLVKKFGFYISEGCSSAGAVLNKPRDKTLIWHKRLGHLIDKILM